MLMPCHHCQVWVSWGLLMLSFSCTRCWREASGESRQSFAKQQGMEQLQRCSYKR